MWLYALTLSLTKPAPTTTISEHEN